MTALETRRMKEVVEGLTTVSDRIRALDAAGFERAEIARFLQKRYQHVRNVLVADQSSRAVSSQPKVRSEPVSRLKARIQVGAGGRMVIPVEIRTALGVGEGDILSAQVVDGELRLLSQVTAVRKAQELVRRYIPEGVSLVDQLIEERRSEASREGSA